MPWVESPLFNKELSESSLSEGDKQMAKKYHDDGYLVIDEDLLDGINVSTILRYQELIGKPNRLQDGWQECEPIRKIALHDRVLAILKMLYGRDPVPFQTLNFRFGTQQPAHSDSIHFSTITPRWMCGVWVALEDINEDQGPLVYYPKSHKLPEYDLHDFGVHKAENPYEEYEKIMTEIAKGYEERRFTAKKGQGLIWSSNILHGGSEVLKQGPTRLSQVTHYFFEDVIPITPLSSNMKTGEYFVRTGVIDIRYLKPMKISLHGTRAEFIGGGAKKRIVLDEKERAEAYVLRYADIKKAGCDPFKHYIAHGFKEGRIW